MKQTFAVIVTSLLVLVGAGCGTEPSPDESFQFSYHIADYDYYDGKAEISGEYWFSPNEVPGDTVCFDLDESSRAKLPVESYTLCFWNTKEAKDYFGIRNDFDQDFYQEGQPCFMGTRNRATVTIVDFAELLIATEGADRAVLAEVVSHDPPACQP